MVQAAQLFPSSAFTRPGRRTLTGHFYDLKQFKDGKPSKLEEKDYPIELKKFVNSGWNPANLERFFVGPNPLYTTQIFIPSLDASQGPLAFGLGGRVQPKMWVVHYQGNVVPTESGTFHFVGVGDDVLVVRFNGRVVLDAGFCSLTDHQPSTFYPSVGLKLDPKNMGFYKGLGKGDPVQVTGGQSYPIDILIGEWPGGQFKVFLMLEKEGVEYRERCQGQSDPAHFQTRREHRGASKYRSARLRESRPGLESGESKGAVGNWSDGVRECWSNGQNAPVGA